ncbi:MAG: DUF1697 domain-containing protein [Thermoguttaceae bacterium]|jgi:uncharacterized protein (DUF1697 family)
MDVFIALYRGINVVGRNLVKMESLRAMHERLGHQGVKSYVQSGNIVFSANGLAEAIGRLVAAEFLNEFGFAAKVLVVDAKRWGTIVEGNPYAKFAVENPKTVHVGICAGEPSAKGLKALLTKTGGSETFVIGKAIVYLHAPDGFGTSKFAAGMEKAGGVPMTVRNWRTAEALWKMSNAGA